MTCIFCGALVGVGNQHVCDKEPVRRQYRQPRPQRRVVWWTVAGCVIVALVVTTWAIWAAEFVELRQLHQDVSGSPDYVSTTQMAQWSTLEHQADDLELPILVVVLTYIVGYVVWFRVARQLALSFGDRDKTAVSHWTFLVWRLSLFVLIVLSLRLRTGRAAPTTVAETMADVAEKTRDAMILGTARCATGLLLIVALLVMMRRVRAWANPVDIADTTLPAAADPAV